MALTWTSAAKAKKIIALPSNSAQSRQSRAHQSFGEAGPKRPFVDSKAQLFAECR